MFDNQILRNLHIRVKKNEKGGWKGETQSAGGGILWSWGSGHAMVLWVGPRYLTEISGLVLQK